MPVKPAEQPRQDRQIRVFISSTFRDMQAERDYLVKFIFPELRKLCESRGVTWGEVDLRWGVTDEQKAEGKVLPICLEEIRRCRPYFIGLIGERYGWIPKTISKDLLDREPWLHEQLRGRKSVTELEIIHGVLREEQMHGHAYFYFRDPQYVETVPGDKRPDFTAENAECAEKLHRLKGEIRHARDERVCQLREDYRDPKQLGDWIREDFTQLIDQLFPEGSQPDPLDREALDHEAYAQSRERVYIGQQEYFDRLNAHANGTDDQPLVILGESGSGKSALLANWVARYRQAHPNAFVLQHYIGATPYSADWAAMLRRIMGEFKRRLGIQQDIPDKPDALRGAFPNWLHMAAAKGRVVLVLDALNQLDDRDGAPDLVWLPPVMPVNVRLIVSTLPGRTLEEVEKRHWPTMMVKPLNVTERKQLIAEYLAQSAKHVNTAQLEHIATAPQSANPLYLRVLLDELRLFGRHEELDQYIGHCLQAESPRDLYRRVIARWEDDYGAGTTLVSETLSLLWAARRGLSEAELLEALGTGGQPLPRAVWSPLFLAMADALVSRGGLLSFAHDFLRTAAREAYVPGESAQQQSHLRLADFFARQPTSPRRTDELPWQLAEAKAWQRLQALLTNRTFFTSAWEQNQFEVKAYWAQIEGGSPLRMVMTYRALVDRSEMEQDKVFLKYLALLLADTGHPKEALRLRSALVQHCRDSGDLNSLQRILGNQALSLFLLGDLDAAMALNKEAEQIGRQLGNLDGLQRSLGNQAAILQARGDLDGAMALHKEKERICRQLGNLTGLQASLGNQAIVLYERGDLAGAMALFKQQEQLSRQLGNLDGLSKSLNNQAVILNDHGNLDGAMVLHKEKERICRRLGDLEGLEATLCNQAVILYARGDLDGSLALLKEDERIGRQLGNLDGLQRSLGNQAVILQARRDLDGAVALLKENERICRQLGNVEGLARSLVNQASVLHQQGQAQEGLALIEEAHRLATSHGYAALARQFEPSLNAARQAAAGS